MSNETRKYSEVYFAVIGIGAFPFDMLRYDNCTPATEGHDAAVMGRNESMRIIWMRRLVAEPVSSKFRGPTEGRWSSFGWSVISGSARNWNPGPDERDFIARNFAVMIADRNKARA